MPSSDPVVARQAAAIVLAPLPAQAGIALKGPRREPWRGHADRRESSASLIPIFYAALAFLAGISTQRLIYLRPGYLLISIGLLSIVSAHAIFKASHLRWLPLGLLWLVLGFWSAAMEPAPAASPELTRLSDGLLRTVEGTVIDAGAVHSFEDDEPDDNQDEFLARHEPQRATQHIDLKLTAAEVVTDTVDQLQHLNTEAQLRLSIVWPGISPMPIHCGDRVRAVVRMLPPEVYHDPGVWSRAAYLEGQQVGATGSVSAAKQDAGEPRLMIIKTAGMLDGHCLLNKWRNLASERLSSLPALSHSLPKALRASPEDAAMLTALLTGDRTWLTRGIRAGFERTGSFHLIVVSGLHLAILAGCVSVAARRLRLPRLAAMLLTISITLAYALFTGFAIPAQRSFWMITLYLAGRFLFRNRSPLNIIGFATLSIAAHSPRSIFDASLQMTVISVAAIAGVALPLLEKNAHAWAKATKNLEVISLDPRLSPAAAQLRVTLRMICLRLEKSTSAWTAWTCFPWLIRSSLRVVELLFVTLVVELALALPMAIYFHRITVYALPVNLIVLPLLGLLVPAAMVTLLVLSLAPALAFVPAAVCLGVLHLSIFVVRGLGSFAFGDLRVPEPSVPQITIALLLFVFALLLARGAFPAETLRLSRTLQRRFAFVAIVAMAIVALWPQAIRHASGGLLLEVIDVGQGDSLLLISPDGKTLLVDGGGIGFPSGSNTTDALRSGSERVFDIGEEVVSAVLWSRGIRQLDVVALTHAHHDHIGGLPAILSNFKPRELWVGNNPPVAPYTELLNEAAALGVRVRQLHAGDQRTLGQVALRVLAPDREYQPGSQPTNNDSLVMQARFGNTSVLLTGDAEVPEERTMIHEEAEMLASTVLKVGHHGSISSTRPEFLARVAPQLAVISCGRRNRFGHPRAETLAALQAAHARTFRTDIDGATCLLLDGQTVHVQPMCTGSAW